MLLYTDYGQWKIKEPEKAKSKKEAVLCKAWSDNRKLRCKYLADMFEKVAIQDEILAIGRENTARIEIAAMGDLLSPNISRETSQKLREIHRSMEERTQ